MLSRARAAGADTQVYCVFNLGEEDVTLAPLTEVPLEERLDSAHSEWGGPGNDSPPQETAETLVPLRARSLIVYETASS